VSAYLIKSDMSKLNPAEMAHYFEDRLGWAVTTAWNLNVKDIEQTISGVCKRVCFLDINAVSMCSSCRHPSACMLNFLLFCMQLC